MGDVGEDYRAWKEMKRQKREDNLAKANPEGWTQHTEYHWSRKLNGERLDYWPSRNKWQFKGRIMTGNVDAFVAKRLRG